jgi:hypothetical protein
VNTYEILLKIADRLEISHSAEAMRLRFCASQVQFLEETVNAQIAEAIELMEPRKRLHRRRPRLVTPTPGEAA